MTLTKKMNTKSIRVRKHSRILGTSIAECPLSIEDREELGSWDIDTVEGKNSDDNALLTLIESKSRHCYTIKIDDQNHDSVDYSIKQLQKFSGELFPQVFKTINSVNGSEFRERHESLVRRYIPKGKEIPDYSRDAIQHIYQTLIT